MNKLFLAVTIAMLALGHIQAAEHSREAVQIDPDSHQVVFENEHVRVIENLSSAGKTSPMHTHGSMLIVSLDLARLRVTLPGGESSIVDLRPGQVMWTDDPEHAWQLLAGQLHVIAIEVKSAAKSN